MTATTAPELTAAIEQPGQGDKAVIVRKTASGQPRAYADHQYIYRVSFFAYSWHTGGQWAWIADDKTGYELREGEEVSGPQAHQIAAALGAVGADTLPKRTERPDDYGGYFMSYLDYAKVVAPGVIEIRTVTPYTD